MSNKNFRIRRQCDDCPWRRDAPLGHFSEERFTLLKSSVEQGFGKMFACHKTACGKEAACVGYIYNQVYVRPEGPQNFNLRLAISRREVDIEQLQVEGDQYDSFDEMVGASYEENVFD